MMDTEQTEIDQVPSFDSREEEEKENCALFLGDLSIYCDEKDIEEAFAPYGNIVDVRIQRSKETSRALSYGFIEFSSQDSAAAALSEMNYFLLKGRPLRIRWAASRNNPIKSAATPHDSAATVYVRFLTQAADVVVSEETLRNIFSNYGPVFDCAIKKLSHDQKCNRTKGYAFVSFDSGALIQGGVDIAGVDAAYRACNDLRNRVVGNVRYRCEFGNRLQKQYGGAIAPLVPQMLPQAACYVAEMPLTALPPPITTYAPQYTTAPQYPGNVVSPLNYTVPHNTPMAGSNYQHQRPVEARQSPPNAQYTQPNQAYQSYSAPSYSLASHSVDSMNGSPSHYQQQLMQQGMMPAPQGPVSPPQVSVKQHNGYASAPAAPAASYPVPLTTAGVMQQQQQHMHQGQHHGQHHQQQQNLQTAYQVQIQAQAQAQAQMQAQAQAQQQAQLQAQQQGYAYSQYQQYQYSPRVFGSNSNNGTPTHASTVHTVTPTHYNNGMMSVPVMMVPVHMPMTPGGQMVYSQQLAQSNERPYRPPQQPQAPLAPQTFMQGLGKAFIGSSTQGSCSDYFAERGFQLPSISTQSFEELQAAGVTVSTSTHAMHQTNLYGNSGTNSRDTTPRSLYNQRGTRSAPGSRRNSHVPQHGYNNNANAQQNQSQGQGQYQGQSQWPVQNQGQGQGQGYAQSHGYNHSLMAEMHKPASRRGSNDSVGTINMFLGCASTDDCASGDMGAAPSSADTEVVTPSSSMAAV